MRKVHAHVVVHEHFLRYMTLNQGNTGQERTGQEKKLPLQISLDSLSQNVSQALSEEFHVSMSPSSLN